MNSLTTVGGTVIDAADMDIVNNAEQAGKKHAGPRAARRRMNARRGQSVDFDFAADITIDSLDDIAHPSSAKACDATSMDQASLRRHRSAPANGSGVETRDNEHSSHRPRSNLNNPASHHCKNMDERFEKMNESCARDDLITNIDETNLQRYIPRSPMITTLPSQRHDKSKQSILAILYDISKSEPYASSAYFRQLFTTGIRNVENHNAGQAGGQLTSVQDALRMCFGINENLIQTITEDVNSILERKRVKDESLLADGRRNDEYRGRPTTTENAVNSMISIPNSSADQTTRSSEFKSPAHQVYPHPHSHFSTPTDLSGYIQSNHSKNGGLKTPKSNPSHDRTSSLPSTPLNYGKQNTPSSHTQHCELLRSKPAIHVMNTTLSASERTTFASSALHEQADVSNQTNEQVCSRVQQYLHQLEERIRSVKKGHTATAIVGQERVRNSRDGLPRSPRHHSQTEASSTHGAKPKVKNKLLLPSLLSPGNEHGVKESHQTSVTFRDNRVTDETEMDIPLDETDQGAYRAYIPASVLSPHDNHSSLICNSEEKVRAAEKSVGLKSLREYKQLLQERTMELEGLEHKYKTQLEQAERELEGQDEQVKQFRLAMKEAGMTVMALEKTIQSLEAAVNEKDALIAQLECRVKSLETELEQSQVTKLEGEIQHLETVTTLNESISQMAMDIKQKETSLSELQAKTTELESELSKALEQLTTAQTDLVAAQKSILEKDLKLQVSENEALTTKEMLHGHIELYKNEVSLSLQNTTRLMDLMTKEKDSLIESLNAKISILEESLAEVEEEKAASSKAHDEKEKELNDTIKKKDEQIAMLQKSKKSEYTRKSAPPQPSSSYYRSRNKGESLRSHNHRHKERRASRVPIAGEEYYEPYQGGMHEKLHRFDEGRYYEYSSSMPITREEEGDTLHSSRYNARKNGIDERYHLLATSPRSRYYYNKETRDDEPELMKMDDDDEYRTTTTTRHRRHAREGDVHYHPLSADGYTFDDGDSIYDFS